MENKTAAENTNVEQVNTKFCKHCGAKIPSAAVICTHCGCQVEEMHKAEQPSIVINNANNNSNTNTNNVNAAMFGVRARNKWVALLLCVFLGYFGAHKFYEGKAGMGILYLFTCGLFGIGWFIDCISILCKPNPYYVR
jgi:restriction system protein